MSTNQQRREATKRKLERQQERRGQRDRRRKRNLAIVAAIVVVAVTAATVEFAIHRGSAQTEPNPPAASTGPGAPGPATPTQVALPALVIPAEVTPVPTRPTPVPATVDCTYQPEPPAAKPVNPPPTSGVPARGTAAVSLTSTAGQIDLQLDRALAPCTVNNFLSLAQQGYFSGTTCHRLTTSPRLQVLQCGDPTGQGNGGPGYSFADETFPQLTYGRGLVAMANAGPNTNGSQFFMIYGTARLPPDYTVFGSLAPATLSLLDGIARAGYDDPRQASEGDGTPHTKVTFTAAKVG